MRRLVCSVLLTLSFASLSAAEEGWKKIFDGKYMQGWKASENKDSWKVKNGEFVCNGPRSHLFYMDFDKPLRNFEFRCKVMTKPGANAGIYFHTRYQEQGWPKYGYECQVNITHGDPKKSGSLYGVVNVANPPAKDNEWYTQHIIVKDRRVILKINDKVVVDFTEPKNQKAFSKDFERRLGSGTIAFQAHDPKSVVHFKDIELKRLP